MCKGVPSRAVLFATQRSRSDRGGRVRLVMRDTSCWALAVGRGMFLAVFFLDPPFILSGVWRGIMPRAPGAVFAKVGCSLATSGHHGTKCISEEGCEEKRTPGGGIGGGYWGRGCGCGGLCGVLSRSVLGFGGVGEGGREGLAASTRVVPVEGASPSPGVSTMECLRVATEFE